MPLEATSMRVLPPVPPAEPRRRRAPFWRGAAGAVALAAWSVAGVLGAALALLPVALEDGPRGRVRTGARIGRAEPATPRLVATPPAPDHAARVAGEALPG